MVFIEYHHDFKNLHISTQQSQEFFFNELPDNPQTVYVFVKCQGDTLELNNGHHMTSLIRGKDNYRKIETIGSS